MVGEQPPVNVRRVGGKHNTVKQADSCFGGRCSRKSSEAPLRPDSPLPVGPLNLMTFATGGTPRAGSRHSFTFNKRLFSYGFPCGSAGKESACNVRDLGSIPGLGRSPGEGNGYPLQYSGLENSMDHRPCGDKESDTTEQFSLSLHFGTIDIFDQRVNLLL